MNMFEANRILMAVLIALLAAKVSGLVGESLVSPKFLDKNVYVVAVSESTGSASMTSTGPEKAEPVDALLVAANVENGQQIAKKCLQCHTFNKGGANKIGPNLWNVVGRKLSSESGYTYSKAFQEKGGVWDYETLNHYLYKPSQWIPGTKMSFAGLRKPQDRADVIAYLRSLSDQPAPLPQPQAQPEAKTQLQSQGSKK